MARSIGLMAARMNAIRLLGLTALFGSALAANTTASSNGTATTSATTAIKTLVVQAGLDGITYQPSVLTANVGDIIEFDFHPDNHSVSRAEYKYPCLPIEYVNSSKVGFWSGFKPVKPTDEGIPKYYIRVNDTDPIFFYCSAPGACINNGMVGVVNPSATQTYDVQLAFALNSTIEISPGEPRPSEGLPTSSSTPTPTPAPSSGGSSLGGGAIAGIVVGGVVVIALAAFTFYLCGRNRTLASVLRYSHPPPRAGNGTAPSNAPYSPSPQPSPYTPSFSPKIGQTAPGQSPGLNHHDSWTSAPGYQRAMSPELAAPMSEVNQHGFVPGQGYGYNAVDNPANGGAGGNRVRIQSSPGEAPWSPGGFGLINGPPQGQYAQVPQNHEMGGEGVISPGVPSPGFIQAHSNHASYTGSAAHSSPPAHQQDFGPHELDARSSVPETPQNPPEYRARAFSFNEGGEAPPGVEKVLRE